MLTTVKRQHALGFSVVQEKICDFFAVGFICALGKKNQRASSSS